MKVAVKSESVGEQQIEVMIVSRGSWERDVHLHQGSAPGYNYHRHHFHHRNHISGASGAADKEREGCQDDSDPSEQEGGQVEDC